MVLSHLQICKTCLELSVLALNVLVVKHDTKYVECTLVNVECPIKGLYHAFKALFAPNISLTRGKFMIKLPQCLFEVECLSLSDFFDQNNASTLSIPSLSLSLSFEGNVLIQIWWGKKGWEKGKCQQKQLYWKLQTPFVGRATLKISEELICPID